MQCRRVLVVQVVAVAILLLVVLVLQPPEILQKATFYGSAITTKPDQLWSHKNQTSYRQHWLDHRNNSLVAPANSSIQAKVIIVTYMRSGSSLTGDLFNHHPRAFYVYEPLWALRKQAVRGSPVLFFNKPAGQPVAERWFQPTSEASANVKAFLDCDFYALDPLTLSQYHLTNSLTTAGYYQCRKRRAGILGILDCLPLLFRACGHRDVRVVKTIRFSMQQAVNLMNADPKTKIIHLVRDPRPTLRSQLRVGKFRGVDVNQGFTTFCQRVLADLQLSDKIKPLFPGRILTIRYEDLAMEPLKFAEKVLAFAGLPMSEKLRGYVWNITSAGLPNSCAICTTRSSSRKSALAWRRSLNLTLSLRIDARCAHVYGRMGYLPLSSGHRCSML